MRVPFLLLIFSICSHFENYAQDTLSLKLKHQFAIVSWDQNSYSKVEVLYSDYSHYLLNDSLGIKPKRDIGYDPSTCMIILNFFNGRGYELISTTGNGTPTKYFFMLKK